MKLHAVLCAALAGCAYYSPNIPVEYASCKDRDHCDRMWAKVQIVIAQSSHYGIRTASDAVIATYPPRGTEAGFAWRATRNPNPDGSAVIGVRAYCNADHHGCLQDPGPPTRAFGQALRSMTE